MKTKFEFELNNCPRHKYSIPLYTYGHPNDTKIQHQKWQCEKCGDIVWRNNETHKIYRY